MPVWELKRTNEKKETLFKQDNVNLKISFFWNSHGTLVKFTGFNNKETFSRKGVDVEIIKRTFELDDIPFETWDIYMNGQLLNGSVSRYHYIGKTNNLHIKMTVGWG